MRVVSERRDTLLYGTYLNISFIRILVLDSSSRAFQSSSKLPSGLLFCRSCLVTFKPRGCR